MRLEGLGQLKIRMTSSGIDPAPKLCFHNKNRPMDMSKQSIIVAKYFLHHPLYEPLAALSNVTSLETELYFRKKCGRTRDMLQSTVLNRK
jgi:hypothetical protein